MSRRMERSLATLITVINALGLFGGPPGTRDDEIRPTEPTAIVETAVPAVPDEESSERRCVHEALVDRAAETVPAHDDASPTDARN